jgi:hypothetical protein
MRRLILVFCFILITIAFAACRKEEEPLVGMTFTPTKTAVPPTNTVQPTHTPTIPRPTSTQPPSPTPSLTPSITPTPLPTSTPTSTPLPDIYLTPSTPAAEAAQYRLVPWTADHADNLGRLMEKLSEENREHFDNYQQEGWHRQTYTYPVVAYREALFRYPEDSRTDNWRMKKIINDAESGQADYEGLLNLIVETLNDGHVPLQNEALSEWFNSYPSIFDIQLVTLEPLPGFINSHILEVDSTYEIGGFTALILENEGGFAGQVIFSSLGNYASLTHDVEIGYLTGDGWS